MLSAQTPGTLDSTFNGNGIFTKDFGFQDNMNDITLQPNQKIICTGVALTPAFTGELKVLRLNSNGVPDSTFATNGVYSLLLGVETYGVESHVRSDGKIIVSGITYDANYYANWMLLRLDSTGTLDSTFGTNGITVVDFFSRDDLPQALTIQPDEKILVSGTSTDTINYFNNPTIVRFTENGIVDSSFGVNGVSVIPAIDIDNELTSIAVQSNGKIVAAGHYSPVFIGSMNFDVLLVRLDTNGLPDVTFGNNGVVITPVNGGIDDSFGMEIDNDGNIVVAGFTTLPVTLYQDMILLKYDSTGTLDPSFGTAGIVTFSYGNIDYATDLKIQPDNKIVICGSSGTDPFSGQSYFVLWRYLTNGAPDSTFGTNGFVINALDSLFQEATAIALQNDGKILTTGKFRNVSNNNNDIAVLRYNNTFVTSIDDNNLPDKFLIYPNPVSAGQAITIYTTNDFAQDSRIEIFDILGNNVLSSKLINSNDKKYQINIPSNLNYGLYFISISDRGKSLVQKLVIN